MLAPREMPQPQRNSATVPMSQAFVATGENPGFG